MWHNQAILSEAKFALQGSLKELERLAAEVEQFCAANRLDGEAAFQLNLALEELFVNAVRHGGCEGIADAAQIRLIAEAGGVQVQFRDRGRAFDPTEAPAAGLLTPLAEREAGGLGIHLVREIMREIEYRREDGWNVLRMRRIAPAAVGQTEEFKS